jgi:hypothetical protein
MDGILLRAMVGVVGAFEDSCIANEEGLSIFLS